MTETLQREILALDRMPEADQLAIAEDLRIERLRRERQRVADTVMRIGDERRERKSA